jgi:hypothetical protein
VLSYPQVSFCTVLLLIGTSSLSFSPKLTVKYSLRIFILDVPYCNFEVRHQIKYRGSTIFLFVNVCLSNSVAFKAYVTVLLYVCFICMVSVQNALSALERMLRMPILKWSVHCTM